MPQEKNNKVVNFPGREEEEIDLLELFFELLKHWKMIALSTVLVGAIFACYSFFLITPTYQSTSALYVFTKSTSITSLADLQTGTNLTKDYKVVVTGRPVLDQVIYNLGLEDNYKSLSNRVSVSNPSDSRILEITVTDTDPESAKQIADEIATVASAYIADKMDQDPPSIIQYGYSDNGKVAPSNAKNTLIGLMLGFILAAAVVIISHLLNDTIMTAEDVEKKLGLNVLGTLPIDENIEKEESRHKKPKKAAKKKKKPSSTKTADRKKRA